MRIGRLWLIACGLALAAQGPALAEEEGEAPAEDSSTDSEEEELPTLSEALEVLRQNGLTTLGDESGNFEATLIAHAMLNVAGTKVRERLAEAPIADDIRRIIIMSGRDRIDLSARHQVDMEFDRIDMLLRRAASRCETVELEARDENGNNQSGLVSDSAVAIIKAAIDFFSHSTSIDPAKVALGDGPMRNAVMAQRLRREIPWVSPDEQLGPHPVQARLMTIARIADGFAERPCAGDGDFEELLDQVRRAMNALVAPAAAEGADDAGEEDDAPQGDAESTDDSADNGGRGNTGLLARALDTPPFTLDNSLILRINLAGVGGSRVVRSNFLTLVGAEAAFVNSGFAVDYSLVDPRAGEVIGSGVVTCMSPTIAIRQFRRPGTGCE